MDEPVTAKTENADYLKIVADAVKGLDVPDKDPDYDNGKWLYYIANLIKISSQSGGIIIDEDILLASIDTEVGGVLNE